MSEIAKDLSLESNVKQSEEINMSEIAEDEEPPDSEVKEEDDFIELEIQRHGIIQANCKHWKQITMIKPNLKTHFSSKKSKAKFIFKLVLLVIRLGKP